MKTLLLALPIILLSCSSPNKSDTLSADSTATKTDSVIPASPVAAETPEVTNLSTPVDSLSGVDSLFNFLARRNILRGAFGDVTVLTDKLIQTDSLDAAQNMLAVLFHSGEGQGYETQFATEYNVLAVFELKGGQVTLVDYVDLGDVSSYGLQKNNIDGDSVMLAENKFAARVTYSSSEEGAGDSGYRHESAELYVLWNSSLVKVFEHNIEDFSFASDEQDYYRETTTTTTFTVLSETSKGLFNLQVSTTTVSRDSEDSEQPNKESNDEGEWKRDGTYRWNGKIYEWVKE